MDWLKLVSLLKGHKVYLQTHNFPDPDALASAFGMQVFLRAHGVETTICYAGEVEANSTKKMMEVFQIDAYEIDNIHDMKPEDYIVTIDGQKFNSNLTDFPGDEVACIDHHPTMKPCAYQYSDLRICGACASIVASYFKESGTTLDVKTATALLYGIKMDTDSFNRGVTDFDIEMFAYLHQIADNQIIISLSHNNYEIQDLYAYGEAIRNIKIYENVGFASISFDCPDALVAMISDFILGLDIVEFAVVYAARNGGYKFSVRNETKYYHAGTVTARALKDLGDGGGHFAMAGGMIFPDKVYLLGDNPHFEIQQLFMNVLYSIDDEIAAAENEESANA